LLHLILEPAGPNNALQPTSKAVGANRGMRFRVFG
jgi:hypothetical protein